MKKELVLILLVILVVLGGAWYLGRKQNQNPTPANNEMPVNQQNTQLSTNEGNVSDRTDVSKNQISLTVSEPVDGQTTTSSSIIVKVKTVPNADVSVNDIDLKADAQGNFSTSLTLDDGENDITVVAVNDQGQSAEKDLTITYDSGSQTE